MKEKDFQSIFTKWCKENAEDSAAYELKITSSKTLAFSKIEEHQITSLKKAKHGILFHKISDSAIGFKPFDCFTLVKSKAYLVVMFYKPRMKKVCYAIDIDDLSKLMARKGKGSITEEDAKFFGITIYL